MEFLSSILFWVVAYALIVGILVFIQSRTKTSGKPSFKQQIPIILALLFLPISSYFVRKSANAPRPSASQTTKIPYFSCTLYGFPEGAVLKQNAGANANEAIKAPLQQSPPGCAEDLQQFVQTTMLSEIIVQGRTDERELSREFGDEYGSNMTLAYRRAESVVKWLNSVNPRLTERAKLLAAGPEYTNRVADARLLARDRSVYIRAEWERGGDVANASVPGEGETLNRADALALVGAIVALSAYLAAVGVFLREQMKKRYEALAEGNKPKKDEEIQNLAHNDPGYMKTERALRLLILADVPAILAALAFVLHAFSGGYASQRVGLLLLSMSLSAVIVFHVTQWGVSVSSWLRRL